MKTIIIGGGLSGLSLADMLQSQGHEYEVLEARSRFGGRIKTQHLGSGYFDMGPAWFWPGQPRIDALIDRLGLERFDQFVQGLQVFEDERGHIQRGRGFASMQGSWRLKGGLGALTQALADRIPAERKHLNASVKIIEKTATGVVVTLSDGRTIQGDRLVLALPPRVAAQITYDPLLGDDTRDALQNLPTWMAGQAKAVVAYDRPFWREEGLSGDASSRFGPMVEIHDASPVDGGPYALFGFIGVAPQQRRDQEILRQNILAQLVRLFGPAAAEPIECYIKDWAFDPNTSTPSDLAPLYAHPTYELAAAMTNMWDGRIHFAGTEVAPQFGGYLEGALEAAENTLRSLTS